MTASQVIEADLTWTGDRFRDGIQVVVDPSGEITAVGALGLPADLRLRERALLPGFVNVHSHAFQRGLRGRGERFPAGVGSFWSWREAMYALVQRVEAAEFRSLCIQAYREMLRSGITTVGEFHYLHHSPGTVDWALDRLVLEAAQEAGIRLVLLQAYYRSAGFGRPLEPAQRRFDGVSPAAYWEHFDRLAPSLDPATQRLGAVAHSVRAVSPEEIAQVHREALSRGLVFHIHVEEQQREVDDCLAAHGQRPMALLLEHLETASNVTAVHCTHTAPEDLARFLTLGGTVCACPLTEGNLGDGLADHVPAFEAGRLCLGTDSNAVIAMPEEVRWLEYVQRLRTESRGVLRPAHGGVARGLLEAATQSGARALGVPAGRIAPGYTADFCTLDLGAPELAGADRDTLLDAFLFGAGTRAMGQPCVGGRWHSSG